MLTKEEIASLRTSAEAAKAYAYSRFATRAGTGDETPPPDDAARQASPLPIAPAVGMADLGGYCRAIGPPERVAEYVAREAERWFTPHYPVMPLGQRRPADPSHPQGLLRMGGAYCVRVVYVFAQEPGATDFVCAFPWVQWGAKVPARLLAVQESANGLEARVTAEVEAGDADGMALTFFDPLYAERWPYYAAAPEGARYRLYLSGLGIRLGIAPPQALPFDASRLVEGMRRHGLPTDGWEGADAVSTQGFAMLAATRDERPDEYEFSGTVQSLKPQLVLGEEGWVARVRVIPGDEDDRHALDLPVAFTRAALEGDLPRVGEDVHGWLWLQGWMDEWLEATRG